MNGPRAFSEGSSGCSSATSGEMTACPPVATGNVSDPENVKNGPNDNSTPGRDAYSSVLLSPSPLSSLPPSGSALTPNPPLLSQCICVQEIGRGSTNSSHREAIGCISHYLFSGRVVEKQEWRRSCAILSLARVELRPGYRPPSEFMVQA